MTNPTTDAAQRGFMWRHLILSVFAMAAVVLLSNTLVHYRLHDIFTLPPSIAWMDGWTTLGAFAYPLTYFVTDLCNRWAGPALARRVAWAGFLTGVAFSFVFHVPWRVALASGAAFIVSQLLDVAVFNKLRQKSWWKAPLWGSSAATVLDTFIFFSVAFAGEGIPWMQLIAGDLCVKLAMAVVLLLPFRVVIGALGLMPKKAAS